MAKHSMGRCRVCENYLRGIEQCKFCSFEWALDYPPTIDVPFDIFELDDEIEWIHLQILDRLHYKGIECLKADMWMDNNIAYLIGVKASSEDVARALHIHSECVYDNKEDCLMILNLFQEKWIRGELDGE